VRSAGALGGGVRGGGGGGGYGTGRNPLVRGGSNMLPKILSENVLKIATFLIGKLNAGGVAVQYVHRELLQLLPVTENGNMDMEKICLPIVEAEDDMPIVIPYVGQVKPRTLEALACNEYWQELSELADVTRLNQTPTRHAIDDMVKMIENNAAEGEIETVRRQANKSWRNLLASFSQETNEYLMTMTLIGRGTYMARYNTGTAMLSQVATTSREYMNAIDSLAVPALDMSVTSPEECNIVRAFVMHIIDNEDPSDHMSPFLQMVANLSNLQGYEKIVGVCAFMHSGGGALQLTDAERLVMGNGGQGALNKRHKTVAQTREAIATFLQTIPTNYLFFDACFRWNVPSAIAFVLFRMHIKVLASAIIFMVAGGTTGVVVIKDGVLSFTRRNADFALDVGTRFRTATFITKRANLDLVPHAMAMRYISGAGAQLYDPSRDRVAYSSGSFVKDIFVAAVPYSWRADNVWTDLTGKMNADIYNGARVGVSLGTTQFNTCEIYNGIWGHRHAGAHIFSAQMLGGMQRQPTLAVQARQNVHDGSMDTSALKCRVVGHDPMGRDCVPEDYYILNGVAAAYQGSGVEGIIPRKDLM
jgi:hypothetical protein